VQQFVLFRPISYCSPINFRVFSSKLLLSFLPFSSFPGYPNQPMTLNLYIFGHSNCGNIQMAALAIDFNSKPFYFMFSQEQLRASQITEIVFQACPVMK
jgi:hypothetical protein